MIFFIKLNNRSLFTTSDYCKYCHCNIFKLIEIIFNLVVGGGSSSNKVHKVGLGALLLQDLLGGLLGLPLLLREVIVVLPRPVRRQVRVVGGRGVGHRPGAPGEQYSTVQYTVHSTVPGVEVAEVVGELLHRVRRHPAVVPQHLVVAGPAGALERRSFG